MVTLKSASAVTLSSHKKEYPFFTAKAAELVKKYTSPRTCLGMGRYASYKDYGEGLWRIGYGSEKLNKRFLRATDKATEKEISDQLTTDLKDLSNLVKEYVFVSLNLNRRAALLSFAHSIGISSFKTCRLLELINSHSSRIKIIKEWSPYINEIWQSGGKLMIDRRRAELDTFLTPNKDIPTFVAHRCHVKRCLLNLPETYTGAPNQVKAIEYLEKKLASWDPSGEVLRQFFRYWIQKPTGLGSLPSTKVDL